MHYKNGRAAKPGDLVVDLESRATGLLHTVETKSSTCNGRLAIVTSNDRYVTLSKCLHVDDVIAAAETIPDTTKKD